MFYLLLFFNLLKYLLAWLFFILSIRHNFLKVIIIFVIISIYYFSKIIPKIYFKKLSRYRKYKYNRLLKYGIQTRLQHIYNNLIIIIYLILFVGGFFTLRFFNRNNKIDLKIYFESLLNFINKLTIFELILNACLYLHMVTPSI